MANELIIWYAGLIVSSIFYIWAFVRSRKKKQNIINTLILIVFVIQVFIEFPFIINLLTFLFPIVYLIVDYILTKKKIKVKLVD